MVLFITHSHRKHTSVILQAWKSSSHVTRFKLKVCFWPQSETQTQWSSFNLKPYTETPKLKFQLETLNWLYKRPRSSMKVKTSQLSGMETWWEPSRMWEKCAKRKTSLLKSLIFKLFTLMMLRLWSSQLKKQAGVLLHMRPRWLQALEEKSLLNCKKTASCLWRLQLQEFVDMIHHFHLLNSLFTCQLNGNCMRRLRV